LRTWKIKNKSFIPTTSASINQSINIHSINPYRKQVFIGRGNSNN
jgi:hypothetical protein